MNLVTVIMAGGSGKRFWPLSRESRAKQSLPLFSDKTLLQETIERILPISENIVVISSEKQREPIENDASFYPTVETIFEPLGRNTAPCVALANRYISEKWGETAVLVLPADHYIADQGSFRAAIQRGMDYLSKNPSAIGTIGIAPTRAETGYGYIKKKSSVSEGIYGVERFEEKPDKDRAETFYNSGDYLWNGGIFLYTLSSMKKEFDNLEPLISEGVEKIEDFSSISGEVYASIPSISIDYAIMEKTSSEIFSVAGDFGWNDIGSWVSYLELIEKDKNGNGKKGEVHFIESSDNLVINFSSKPVFVFRKKGELLVFSDDATLSASLKDHQEIRAVTEFILQNNLTSFL